MLRPKKSKWAQIRGAKHVDCPLVQPSFIIDSVTARLLRGVPALSPVRGPVGRPPGHVGDNPEGEDPEARDAPPAEGVDVPQCQRPEGPLAPETRINRFLL